MNEFKTGDRIVVANYGWEPEAHLFNGATGIIVGSGAFYYYVILDIPVQGYGVISNPMLLSGSEMEKVSDNG